MNILLLHPPLLSPVVWSRLSPILIAAGHTVSAPDLGPFTPQEWWRSARGTAIAASPQADAVLAHSGAGSLAAPVLYGLPNPRAVILIDAVLPSVRGETAVSPAIRTAVAGLADGGVLPPWPTWWSDANLAELIPDKDDRAALIAQAPRLPESFYDVAVPAPEGWEPAERGYIRLSPAYADEAEEAGRRGWRVRSLPGRHLDLLSDPESVGRVVLELLDGTS